MKIENLSHREQLFTHIDPETGRQTSIAASRLAARAARIEPVWIPVRPEVAELYQRIRGIEPHRLQRCLAYPSFFPLVHIDWPDDTKLLIDGHHRYVAAAQLRHQWILSVIVPERIWRRFIVSGVPSVSLSDFLTKASGIK